jgi:hypothetical protein
MLRLEEAPDRVSGGRWKGNSSYDTSSGRITAASIERWRNVLSPAAIATVEFFCGPEMRWAGYLPAGDTAPTPDVIDYVLAADAAPGKWRSDSGDVVADLGLELLRHRLLEGDAGVPTELARRCFLLPAAADALRAMACQP